MSNYPTLTAGQMEVVEQMLNDVFVDHKDEVAVELGVAPLERGEWSVGDLLRVMAECDRQYRDGVIQFVLMYH